MGAVLQIEEHSRGLTMRVSERPKYGQSILIFIAGVLACSLFLYFVKGSPQVRCFIGVICALSLCSAAYSRLKGTEVELRVSNLDIISKGHAPEGYKPSDISRADVSHLEFRAASGGGEFPELPKGLYIESRSFGLFEASNCLLPHIDRVDSDRAIKAIFDCFPDTGTLTNDTHDQIDLISLNLTTTSKM